MELAMVRQTNELIIPQETSKYIASIEKQIKELKAQEEELKQNLLKEMERHNVIKLETDDIIVTYIASSERETFDSKTFRDENPLIYDEYCKITTVSPSIRIKVK